MNNLYWDFNIESLGPLVGYVLIPLEKTFLTMTIFITVGIAHQGSAMAKDFEGYERISSHQRSRRLKILSYILPVVVASLVINIPLFFHYSLIFFNNLFFLQYSLILECLLVKEISQKGIAKKIAISFCSIFPYFQYSLIHDLAL